MEGTLLFSVLAVAPIAFWPWLLAKARRGRPLGDEELGRRRRAWLALSDLFLDTDIAVLVPGIRRDLDATGYADSELAEILEWEVAPVVSTNLWDIAGVWEGFDGEWLAEHVEQSRRSVGFFAWLFGRLALCIIRRDVRSVLDGSSA